MPAQASLLELEFVRDISDIMEFEKIPFADRDFSKTVYDLLREGAAIDPDRAAFLSLPHGDPNEDAIKISFGDFVGQVHQAANLFNQLGVGRGDVVAILAPTLPQNYIAMFAAVSVGILCPINWMLKPEQIAEILNTVNAKVLVTLAPSPGYDIWEKFEQVRGDIQKLEHVLQIALPGHSAAPEMYFDSQIAAQDATALITAAPPLPDDIAIYAHTGGTTGTPKVAQLLHRAISYKVWCYSVLLETGPEHVVFAGSPLFHIGGILYHTINTLAHGATSLIIGPRGFRNKEIVRSYWKLVNRYGITDFFGVPTTLSALANVEIDADISSLRPYAMTGSAGLPVAISEYFEREIGVRLLCNYGMTENTASIALPPRNGDPKFGSAGLRFPYTQIRIVELDPNGGVVRNCETDQIGNIIIKGPGVIQGYLDDTLNRDCFIETEWFVTGDLGRLDRDEYLWVTGRAKDLIIRSGHNIDPMAIEEALLRHSDVAIVGAVGKPDAYAGELPVAFVQLKRHGSVDAESLRRFAAEHISERPAWPSEIIIVDEIPLTSVGKISKPELRKMIETSTFSGLLAPLKGLPCAFRVDMLAHAKSGTVCNISISTGTPVEKKKAAEIVHRIMGGFTTAYEIEWKT